MSDVAALRNDVRASIADAATVVREITRGYQVRQAVADNPPDLAVIDMQVGKMGGMATCLDLRLEAGAGRLPSIPVLLLLDRRADVFLARQALADGWILKPLDPLRLARAMAALLGGGSFHDDFARPVTVALPSSVGPDAAERVG